MNKKVKWIFERLYSLFTYTSIIGFFACGLYVAKVQKLFSVHDFISGLIVTASFANLMNIFGIYKIYERELDRINHGRCEQGIANKNTVAASDQNVTPLAADET
jgi:hypothetical protein